MRGGAEQQPLGTSADVQREQSPTKFIYQVSQCSSAPKDNWLGIAGGRGDALVDTGHCSLPNINSVHGNRILLFNRTIEVRAGAISHGDASAGGCRERWRTTAMPSRLRGPLGAMCARDRARFRALPMRMRVLHVNTHAPYYSHINLHCDRIRWRLVPKCLVVAADQLKKHTARSMKLKIMALYIRKNITRFE